MPGFGEVFLWFTGSINYSWGLTLFLLFIFPFYCLYMDKSCHIPGAFLCILGLLSGAYSENGASATIFVSSAFLLAIWVSKRKIEWKFVIAEVCLLIGFAFLMTAPSETETRMGELKWTAIISSLQNCFLLTFKYCWGLLILFLILFILSVLKGANKKVLVSSLLFAGGAVVSVGVFAFAAYIPRRSFYIMTVYMTIADMILLDKLYNTQNLKPVLTLAAAMFVLFSYRFIYGVYDISKLCYQSVVREKIIEEAKTSGNLNVVIHEYTTGTAYSEISYEELEESPDWWYNELLARYYGLESVTGIVER